MEPLVDWAGLSGLYLPGIVLWPDMAGGAGTPWLTARSTYLSAYLPGLGVCTLYSWQCLACPDTYSLGGEAWCLATYRLCPQSLVLARLRCSWCAASRYACRGGTRCGHYACSADRLTSPHS